MLPYQYGFQVSNRHFPNSDAEHLHSSGGTLLNACIAGCKICIVFQTASLCKVGQRLINLTDFCIISFHGVFQSKRVGLRTRIMRNLKLHFRKPQSQYEIKAKQPQFAVVPGKATRVFSKFHLSVCKTAAVPASALALRLLCHLP